MDEKPEKQGVEIKVPTLQFSLTSYAPTVTISKVAKALIEVSSSPLSENLINNIEARLKKTSDGVLAVLADEPTPELMRDLRFPEYHLNTVRVLAGTVLTDKAERSIRRRDAIWRILGWIAAAAVGIAIGWFTKG